MAEQFIVRSFKSGNSVALRLPKGLGIEAGEELIVVPHADGSMTAWRKALSREAFLQLFGSVSEGFMAQGRGDTGQSDYDWPDTPDHPAAA
jgi:antitoxin VapB